MNPNAPQGIARFLISEADHLSRVAHREGNDNLSARLAAIRTEASSIERRCGANPPRQVSNVEIDLARSHVHAAIAVAAAGTKSVLDRLAYLADRLGPTRPRTLVGLIPSRLAQ
jgi:hypothetical protein